MRDIVRTFASRNATPVRSTLARRTARHDEGPGRDRGPRGGADDGTRTRDLNLGKVAHYQLCYIRTHRAGPASGQQCSPTPGRTPRRRRPDHDGPVGQFDDETAVRRAGDRHRDAAVGGVEHRRQPQRRVRGAAGAAGAVRGRRSPRPGVGDGALPAAGARRRRRRRPRQRRARRAPGHQRRRHAVPGRGRSAGGRRRAHRPDAAGERRARSGHHPRPRRTSRRRSAASTGPSSTRASSCRCSRAVDVRVRRDQPARAAPSSRGGSASATAPRRRRAALVLFADAFPPAVHAVVARVGWVPTLELTVHVRRRPAAGWVQARLECDDVAGGWMIETGTPLGRDRCARRGPARRQLGMMPRPRR